LLPSEIYPGSTEEQQNELLNTDVGIKNLVTILDQARSKRNASLFLEPSVLFKELSRWKLQTELQVDPKQPILDLFMIDENPFQDSVYLTGISYEGLNKLVVDLSEIPPLDFCRFAAAFSPVYRRAVLGLQPEPLPRLRIAG